MKHEKCDEKKARKKLLISLDNEDIYGVFAARWAEDREREYIVYIGVDNSYIMELNSNNIPIELCNEELEFIINNYETTRIAMQKEDDFIFLIQHSYYLLKEANRRIARDVVHEMRDNKKEELQHRTA